MTHTEIRFPKWVPSREQLKQGFHSPMSCLWLTKWRLAQELQPRRDPIKVRVREARVTESRV